MRVAKAVLGVAAVFLAAAGTGYGQSWPAKPVLIIVSFAAGGPTDVVARLMAQKYGEAWGQPVVVENRPGAGGAIGSALLARAAPDGYTLNLAASSHAYNDALIPGLSYHPVKDFTPISLVFTYSNVLLVHPSVPAKGLRELVAYAKSNPGKLAFASSGSGTGAHLAAELFKRAAGIDILIVHFKGAAPATNDLVAGHLQAMFNNPLSSMPLIKNGKALALATTGAERLRALPEVPTVAESGYPGFRTDTWFGMMGPAGLASEVVNRVARDTSAIVKAPDVTKRMASLGVEPESSTPEQLAELLRSDNASYGKLIREAGIKSN